MNPFDDIRDAVLIERMSRAIRGMNMLALDPAKARAWRRLSYEHYGLRIDEADFDRLDKAAVERNEKVKT
jgi:hypothetical protein